MENGLGVNIPVGWTMKITPKTDVAPRPDCRGADQCSSRGKARRKQPDGAVRRVNWSHLLLLDCYAFFDGRVFIARWPRHPGHLQPRQQRGFYSTFAGDYIPARCQQAAGSCGAPSQRRFGTYSDNCRPRGTPIRQTTLRLARNGGGHRRGFAVVCRCNNPNFG